MFWHIAKRELYDNMNSLRFAFTTILLLALMIVNAVGHFGEFDILPALKDGDSFVFQVRELCYQQS